MKAYIRIIIIGVIISLAVNRFLFRPWVVENIGGGFLLVFVNSFPNFLEAVIGTILVALLLLQCRQQFNLPSKNMKNASVYLLASVITGIYVVLQELKIHNLGGENIYDPYDVVASLVGLVVANIVITRYDLTD